MNSTPRLYPPLKEWVATNIQEDFKKAVKLTLEDSLTDPKEEPFKSLYSARKLFQGALQKLESDCPKELQEHEDFMVLCSCLLLEIGLNYINTEETSSGERQLEDCLHHLEGVISKVKTASISVQAHNQLGVLWGNRSEQQKGLEFLLKSKAVYESYVALPPPITDTEWITGSRARGEAREKQMESQHTLTLFYLAQVYENLEQKKVSAQYCQVTLSRQLDAGDYDPIEWSLNCATMSQYHVTTENWPQARHCLASASCVLQKFKEERCGSVPSSTTGEDAPIKDQKMAERVTKTEADISRCWVKYCNKLLVASVRMLHKDDPHVAEEVARAQQHLQREKKRLFRFESLDVTGVESSIPESYVEDYPGARQIYLACQKHINSAKLHFTLNTHASEYTQIIQEHSQAYQLLTFFEPSPELKCRMHKRRVDMLSVLIKELNPRFYLTEHRELMNEVAETLTEMADLKTVSGSENPSQHNVDKINKLLRSSIDMYRQFLVTYHDPETQKLPEQLYVDCTRSILMCKLNIGRLYSKFIAPNSDVEVSTC